jgi:DNA polymerase III subunit beta
MKFTINKKSLKEWLDTVSHATAWVTTTPILENILIKVNFSSILLVSNNLEMAIEYIITEGIKIDTEGSFSVPSRLFLSYINLIEEDEIEIELMAHESLQIKTNSGKTKIKGKNAEDFPLIPKIKEEINMHINGGTLKKSIEKTLFSSAEGNIRPTLAGIFIQIKDDDAIFASTDSFRLSEYKSKLPKKTENSFSQILPSKTAFEVKSIIKDDDEINIVSGENQIGFFFWNVKVYSRLLNGKFPDYHGFFPSKFTTKAEINKYDLIQALKKINLISRENNYSIKMSFSAEDGIFLETSETQIGEGEVKLKWNIDGENNIIGINSTHFLEVLGVIDTTHISISFENPLAPVLITPLDEEKKEKGTFRHIIMPLKI